MSLALGKLGRQGVRRRLDVDTTMLIDVVATLGRVGVPALEALQMARELQRSDRDQMALTGWLAVRYDAAAHRAELDVRLSQAAERIVTRRRGRPPTRPRAP